MDVEPGFPAEPGADRVARLEVSLSVRSLKTIGPDGKRFDDRVDEMMYQVLRAEAYPKVVYHLNEMVRAPSSHGPAHTFNSKGELYLAGVTNLVSMPVEVEPVEGGRLRIAGSTRMKISAFRIEPPIPAGVDAGPSASEEDAKVSFEWLLQKSKPGEAAGADAKQR